MTTNRTTAVVRISGFTQFYHTTDTDSKGILTELNLAIAQGP